MKVPLPPESAAKGKEICAGYRRNGALWIDACLGDQLLPGVIQCCCGHGQEELAYVVLSDEMVPGESCIGKDPLTYRGKLAVQVLKQLVEGARSA